MAGTLTVPQESRRRGLLYSSSAAQAPLRALWYLMMSIPTAVSTWNSRRKGMLLFLGRSQLTALFHRSCRAARSQITLP